MMYIGILAIRRIYAISWSMLLHTFDVLIWFGAFNRCSFVKISASSHYASFSQHFWYSKNCTYDLRHFISLLKLILVQCLLEGC